MDREKLQAQTSVHIARVNSDDASYDRDLKSRNFAVGGLAVAWLACVPCLVVGIIYTITPTMIQRNGSFLEIVPLLLNILVTLINDSLGFLHSASLRWNLQREHRLKFNSNLRLLWSSRSFAPNSWFANILVMAGMALSYTASSQMFIGKSIEYGGEGTYVFGPALVALAIGWFLQATFTTWAIRAATVPTWSSNPLEVIKASLEHGYIERQPDRTLRGLADAGSPAEAVRPRKKQASAFSSHKEVRIVLYLFLVLILLAIVWVVLLSRFGAGPHNPPLNTWKWALIPSPLDEYSPANTVEVGMPEVVTTFAEGFANLFIITLLQGVLTVAMHCVELISNLSRDEAQWRSATSAAGMPAEYTSIGRAVTRWQTIGLAAIKTISHWLFGLSITLTTTDGGYTEMVMRQVQIVYLGIFMVLVLCLVGVISFSRPSGPQPAAYGHLQTLLDLIDEWPAEVMFWGHKGIEGGFGRAGTDSKPLPKIHLELEYK